MPSGPLDLDRLKHLFHAARELTSGERQPFLDQNCGDARELRREIEALLKASDEAGGFMANPPAHLAADVFGGMEIPSASGSTIGHYKVLERIGSGGMGDVYGAERADRQFEMKVAIKLIKRGMDTESVLRRFQHERQILASLDHPNIARLLDGGTTDDGLPYFVMEYIQGERVDHYADKHALSIEQRLELFRQICGAVSYAHQHLVVHRDLKPSNVLVTNQGVPKLLDFGIAKIVRTDDGGHEALATITVVPILTPEYASPEQIEGTPATTLSDVYSLGAVLYQLLSGHPPHRLKTRSAYEIAETFSRRQLEKPSAMADRPELARRLRGDLDNIVLMAMRREAARRYRSVEQLSEDIRRHLDGRTVIARPDTFSYRTRKFLQRNKIPVAAGALIFLSLIGGIVAIAWEARRATLEEQSARAAEARAERRFNDVHKLANNVLFDYYDAIKNLPGATKVRERLVKDAVVYLDSLASEAHDAPALQRELAAAYERVGDVRGEESSGNLGELSGSVQSYTKAIGICDALLAVQPDDAQARRTLASSHQKIGTRLQPTAEASIGEEHLRKAVTLYLELTREQPKNDDLQLELARARAQLGKAISVRGDYPGALEQDRAAFAICESLVTSNPRDQRYRHGLWSSQENIGYHLFLQNDVADAIEAHEKARALVETLIAEDPLNANYRRSLVISYQYGGDYRIANDKRGALEQFQKAAAMDEQLLTTDPGNALTCKDLSYLHKKIADLLAELQDNSQALLHFRKAGEGYEKVIADAPADLVSQFLVVTCHAGVARMLARLGQIDPALEEGRKATTLLQQIGGGKTGSIGRAQAYEYIGYAYAALAASPKAPASETRKHMNVARDLFRQTLSILDDLRSHGPLGANEEWAGEIAREIAKCDAALGR